MPEQLVTEEQLIPPGAQVVLPPYGFVHLQAVTAGDLDVVNAARVSFASASDYLYATTDNKIFEDQEEALTHQEELDGDGPGSMYRDIQSVLKDDDGGVLRFLMANHHGTPFEHNFFKWHVRAPIFVFREWHRHRIGWSYNEESARYSKLQPHFYEPQDSAWRKQVGKPGKYTYEPLDVGDAVDSARELNNAYQVAYSTYSGLMERGVAKEIARACLPVGIFSQMIACCNARSLMNFLNLRAAPSAMREIRMYAEAMETVFADLMPVTHGAFVDNGRIAP